MRELIINGVTVDLDDKTKIDLQFVSFLFTSINSISAPRSWTVSLPKSSVNLGLIQGASSGDYSGDFPYNNYVVDYYNKGYRLINSGKGILTKIGSRIEFVFTFGKAFEKIKLMSETKLFDLTESETDHLDWNRAVSFADMTLGFGWCNFYSFTNEDRSFTTNPDVPFFVIHPTVTFKYIIEKIAYEYNLDLSGLSDIAIFETLGIPLKSIKSQTALSGTDFSEFENVSNSNSEYKIYFDFIESNGLELINNNIFRKYSYLENEKIRVDIQDFQTTSISSNKIEIVIVDKNEIERTVYTAYPVLGTYTINRIFTLLENDLYFYLKTDISALNYTDTFLNVGFGQFQFIIFYSQDVTGGFHQIIGSLPDMTCSDFLFQAMQLAGVFPEITDEAPDTINFYSADVLFDNIPNAKDWTKKLVKSTKRMSELSDVEFKFGNYAQKNTLAYKKDDTNLLTTDDFLLVENDNLEDKSKLVELKFAAGKRFINSFGLTSDTIDYPLYDIKIQSGDLIKNPKSQSNDVLGKIVNIGGINYLQFTDDLLWSNIKLEDNYAAQQTLLNKPRYIKENFYLKPEDVYNFSTKIPIYLQQYGKYYAIMKLQYRESDFSECELLELKNV